MGFPIEFILLAFMIAVAVGVARLRDLFGAAMLLGIFSLLSAGIMLLMDAVDVSFTEAAVGAGISTVLILGALSLTDYKEVESTHHYWPARIVVLLMGGLLVIGTFDMPHYGDPEAPIHNYIAPNYIEGSEHSLEIPNVVTSILASYRGYDTFGEVTVVLTAAVGAILLLFGADRRIRQARDVEPADDEVAS